MTNEEKRYDAAHTLGVSYDATPSAVDGAYLRRIEQYFNIQSDFSLFTHKLGPKVDRDLIMLGDVVKVVGTLMDADGECVRLT